MTIKELIALPEEDKELHPVVRRLEGNTEKAAADTRADDGADGDELAQSFLEMRSAIKRMNHRRDSWTRR
ncbi:MAG: hypothetical protein J1G38_04045 [Clostridiales bacterium]|nr:hypothetical protein [Clostridiales bacterium]